MLGGACGFVAVIALSMFGIGALLQASLVWLTVMKWVGGLYLVWLGIQVWRAPPIGVELRGSAQPARRLVAVPPRRAVGVDQSQGAAVLRRLPAAVHRSGAQPVLQFVVMAATFAAIEIATEVFIASMAHRISPWLRRVGKRFNQACGGVFVAIGASLPLRG